MSAPTVVLRSTPQKRLIIRGLLLAAYLALALVVFIYGRGHTLLLDNKSAADGSYAGFRSLSVSVNGGEPLQLALRERDKASVVGQLHTVRFEANGQAYEASFRVPFGEDIILVSLPKLAAGIEPFWEPFRSEPVPRAAPAEEELPSLDNPPPIGG
jgi:hypothetical protein